MKIWVLISLLMVFSGERVAVGYPEDSVPEPAAADGGASDPGSAPAPPASAVVPTKSEVGNVQPRQVLRVGLNETERIQCYHCSTGFGGVNKLCENVDEVGLRASGGITTCTILKPEDLEGKNDSWTQANRCVVIKGEGWKKRQCMGAEEFLKAFHYENWKEVDDVERFACNPSTNKVFNHTECQEARLAKEKVLFGVFTKNLDGFKGPCKTYDNTEICSCRENLCNSSAFNVPLASFIITLLSAFLYS